MSKLKCQVKSKCLNDKIYPGRLPAAATGDGATQGGADFSFIWPFDIDLTFNANTTEILCLF